MKLPSDFGHRLKMFLIGVGIGSVLVIAFFHNSTDVITGWMPNARVLKRLRLTTNLVTPRATCQMNCLGIDTTLVGEMKHKGDVDFSNSQVRGKVKTYRVTYEPKNINYTFVYRCEGDTSTLLQIAQPAAINCNCPDQ